MLPAVPRFFRSLFPAPAVDVRFVPAETCFMRVVPVDPALPVSGQVELALEGFAPFPPAQLYWGWCLAPDRREALVYAAHRKRFAADEVASWESADLVVPDLLPLLGAAPRGPAVWVRVEGHRLSGAAWVAGAAWPAWVQARAGAAPADEAAREQFAAELAARAGIAGAPVRFLSGSVRACRESDGLRFECVGPDGKTVAATSVARGETAGLDVRDRAFLAAQRRARASRELVWRVALAGGALAAAALLLDAGALGVGWLARRERAAVAQQADLVRRLETAHSLTNRIDELTRRRLRFFEMLAVINGPRPASLLFTRTANHGRTGLEVEGQTGTADDVGAYEAALQALPAVEKVEVPEIRARDGVTTFTLRVVFRSEGTLAVAGAGGVR